MSRDERRDLIDPSWVVEAADSAFGPAKKPLSGRLDSSLGLIQGLEGVLSESYRIRGRRFSSLGIFEQQAEVAALCRRLGETIDAHHLAEPKKLTGENIDVRTFKYSPHPIEVSLLKNGSLAPSAIFPLRDRQKRMLAYFAGITLVKVEKYINPWITRSELAKTAGDLSVNQLDEGLLRPLERVGVMEKSNRFGYRLRVDPEEVLRAVIHRAGEQSLRTKAPEDWYEVRVKSVLLDAHLMLLLRLLHEQASHASSSNSRIDLEQIIIDTGLQKDALYDQLNRFVEQKVIFPTRRGIPYTVASLNRPLLEAIIKAQKPVKVEVEQVEFRESGQLIREGIRGDRLLSLSVDLAEVEPKVKVDLRFLQILEKPFRKEVSGASEKGFLSESYLRPTAIFPYYRSLSKKAEVIPWRELGQLGLAVENARDHHPEMLLVGGLVAALYLNKAVYQEASIHSNGSGAVEFVAFHTAHLLRQEEIRVSAIDPQSERLRYVKQCLKSLEKVKIICKCNNC